MADPKMVEMVFNALQLMKKLEKADARVGDLEVQVVVLRAALRELRPWAEKPSVSMGESVSFEEALAAADRALACTGR